MIAHLTIHNLAIIDVIELDFDPGLSVLTGETGAGKSILIDALGVVLGARCSADMVRSGQDRATVDAVFDISHAPSACTLLTEMGYDVDDGQLIVNREFTVAGKNVCRINGRLATVAQLKQIGSLLVDMHGQHEHQSLLSQHKHLALLDDWAGKPVTELRTEVATLFHQLRNLQNERARLETSDRERAQRRDLLNYQVNEITSANLQPDEDQLVQAEYRRLANAQRLVTFAQEVVSGLSNDDNLGILERLSMCEESLSQAAVMDDSLTAFLNTVRTARLELVEVERDLGRYAEQVEFNPKKQQALADRLELIKGLKRKYGDTIEEIIAFCEKSAAELCALDAASENSARIDIELTEVMSNFRRACSSLTKLRMEAARNFEEAVLGDLRDLALEKAQFEVQISGRDPDSFGADRVEFMISTNVGEPTKPLARTASGGEISRVMLAIKSALARQESLPTMIFDEIDVGVGGRTAHKIADKLENLAQFVQIICITHLAQIASRAEGHLAVEKLTTHDQTTVQVKKLSENERLLEVARMLGGLEPTPAVVQHAREMLNNRTRKCEVQV